MLMSDTSELQHLSVERCWELLTHHSIGRLALINGHEIDMYPVHYAVSDKKIYFHTPHIEKFASVMVSRLVSFEIDETDENITRWVMLRGHANWLSVEEEAQRAEALGLEVSIPAMDSHWVEIEPTLVTGRELSFTSAR